MEPKTPRLTSTTAILTRLVEDPDDLAAHPDLYVVDLFAEEDRAEKAWLRAGIPRYFSYNDGVITLMWDGVELLGVPVWDDIVVLWVYLVNVVDDYLVTGRGHCYFPDQPTPIILERIRGGALITIGDTKLRVDPLVFCRELLDEAERFWHWVDRHEVPVSPGDQRIDRIRALIPSY
ncbi:hypothetical protein C4K88_13245 [Arthrobacter pityocampae]|uniref:DUF402 domain-containing protein n=1 Tax=Arthrobacter pityocampae TaxID=547334 RepID=A0A2S5IVT7_9MICC|nr:hypothetical protein [Arthrobacter pityocampae]PPB48683.1 hypothetical protein C4K88_13245 [Arthrobacter pityocampae]